MNERAIGCNRQAEISTILNYPMTIRSLTGYKWESNRVEQPGSNQHHAEFSNDNQSTHRLWMSNRVEQTGRDQHYSKFPNDNQTTYRLWMREQQGRTDKQISAPFWIPKWQSDHLQTMNERATGWNRQAEISTILNSTTTIRSLTNYEWESNRVKQIGKDQHYSKSPTDNQATYSL